MKQPVNPELFRAKQKRNWILIQFAASLLGLVTIAAILSVALWFAWSNTVAMIAVAAIGVTVAFIPAAVCVVGVMDSSSLIIDSWKYFSEKQNEMAWNAQQEELKRLRNIMKEEGL